MGEKIVIGIVSDTHGHLPDAVLDIFSGKYDISRMKEELFIDGADADLPAPRCVDAIVHAGDIGELEPISQGIIDALEAIAPVHAVLGNRDMPGYVAGGKPLDFQLHTFDVCGVSIAVMHKPDELNAMLRRKKTKPRVQIYGHTHEPKLRRIGPRLMLCPGSIHNPKGDWPRRTVALLYLESPGKVLGARILEV